MQGRQFVEELVLSRLEFGDLGRYALTVLCERIGRAASVAVLEAGERRIRDQRAEAGIVGLGRHVCELFLGDRRFGAQGTESGAHIGQLPLDPLGRHEAQSTVSRPERPVAARSSPLVFRPRRGRGEVESCARRALVQGSDR